MEIIFARLNSKVIKNWAILVGILLTGYLIIIAQLWHLNIESKKFSDVS